jgi:hypothetical protein
VCRQLKQCWGSEGVALAGAYDQAFAGSLTRSSAGIAGIHTDQLEAAAL